MGFLRRFRQKAKTTANQPDAQSPPTKTSERLSIDKKIPLISDVDEFSKLALAGEECAFLIWLQHYKYVLAKIERDFAKQQKPFSFPRLICASCYKVLDEYPSFMLGLWISDKRAPSVIAGAKLIFAGKEGDTIAQEEYGRRGRCFECRGDRALIVFAKTTEMLPADIPDYSLPLRLPYADLRGRNSNPTIGPPPGMILCKNGHNNSPNAKVCWVCGEKLEKSPITS